MYCIIFYVNHLIPPINPNRWNFNYGKFIIHFQFCVAAFITVLSHLRYYIAFQSQTMSRIVTNWFMIGCCAKRRACTPHNRSKNGFMCSKTLYLSMQTIAFKIRLFTAFSSVLKLVNIFSLLSRRTLKSA